MPKCEGELPFGSIHGQDKLANQIHAEQNVDVWQISRQFRDCPVRVDQVDSLYARQIDDAQADVVEIDVHRPSCRLRARLAGRLDAQRREYPWNHRRYIRARVDDATAKGRRGQRPSGSLQGVQVRPVESDQYGGLEAIRLDGKNQSWHGSWRPTRIGRSTG